MSTTATEPKPAPPPPKAEREISLDTSLRHSMWHKVKRGLGLWWRGEVSLRRVMNAGLCHWSLRRRSPKVLGKPFFLMVEPTNVCNLRCPLCPTGRGTLERPRAFLPLDLYKQCIDELGPYLMEVNLTNYGEPMLHRELPEMIAYASKAGAKVFLGTNGHFLTEESSRQLIEAGLDQVYISFDGLDQETYARYRVRGDLAKVRDGVQTLLATREAMGRSNPAVELQFLIMKHNEDQLETFRAVADEIGADRRIIKPVSFNVADWTDPGTLETFEDFFPQEEKHQVYIHEGKAWRWKKDELAFCTAAWRSLVLLADGSIVPCCRDPRGKYTMGNVSAGVLKVWNGEKFRKFRRAMATSRDKLAICNVCPGE